MIETYFFVSLGSAVLLVGFKTYSFKVQVVEAYIIKLLKICPVTLKLSLHSFTLYLFENNFQRLKSA